MSELKQASRQLKVITKSAPWFIVSEAAPGFAWLNRLWHRVSRWLRVRAVCFVHTDQTVENYMSTFSFPLFDSFCAQTVCMFSQSIVCSQCSFFPLLEHIILVSWLWWATSLESVFLKKFKVGIDFLTTLRPGLRFIFLFFIFFYIVPGGKACTWAEVAKRQFRAFLV